MKKKIPIIGGEIAGLTFAHSLSKEKHEIYIFEKKKEFGEVGAAISVFPNALSVMDKIGLLNPILRTSGKFENTEEILKNSLCDRIPKKGWTKGNVTLIGDAAHPSTPNLGQGGCMAIEGAYLLASCINKYGLSNKAYNSYEKYQFTRSKKIVTESLKLRKIGKITNHILIFLRNFFFKVIPSSVTMKMIDKYFSFRVTELKI